MVEARSHLKRAPFPSTSRRLRPAFLGSSLDPNKIWSIFCLLRPYRPCLTPMPCDAKGALQRARQLRLSTLPLRSTRGTEDWITTRLRKKFGGSLARQLLLEDLRLGSVARRIDNVSLMAPVHVPDGFDLDAAMDRALSVLRRGMTAAASITLVNAFLLLITSDYSRYRTCKL